MVSVVHNKKISLLPKNRGIQMKKRKKEKLVKGTTKTKRHPILLSEDIKIINVNNKKKRLPVFREGEPRLN